MDEVCDSKKRPAIEDLLQLPGAAIAYCLLPIALQLSGAPVTGPWSLVTPNNSALYWKLSSLIEHLY